MATQSELLTLLVVFCIAGSFLTATIITDSVAYSIGSKSISPNTYTTSTFKINCNASNLGFIILHGYWNCSIDRGLHPTTFDVEGAEIQLGKVNISSDGLTFSEKYDLDGMLNNDGSITQFLIQVVPQLIAPDYYWLDINGNGNVYVEHDYYTLLGRQVDKYNCPINLLQVLPPNTHSFTLGFTYNGYNKQLAITINNQTLGMGIYFDMPKFSSNTKYERIATTNPNLSIYTDYNTYTVTDITDTQLMSWNDIFTMVLLWNVPEQYLPLMWNIILVKIPLGLAFLFGVVRLFVGS